MKREVTTQEALAELAAAKNIIQQGIATPGLLSYIFINKYCNHMPYYRQSKNFERKGINLSRATMDKWQLEVYEKLKPLERIMLEHVKTGKVLNMDETTTQILHYENGNTKRKKSYVLSRKNFLFCGSEDGARSTCLLFSLIECAIINDINPEEYLSSIFELAADTTDWTDSKWSELLPWNIKLIKRSDVSTVLIA